MSELLPLSGPVDLEALDQFLMSDASPEDCMQLSDVDRFLTGIAIGPELVMPSEWLPAIWGGDEPAFGKRRLRGAPATSCSSPEEDSSWPRTRNIRPQTSVQLDRK